MAFSYEVTFGTQTVDVFDLQNITGFYGNPTYFFIM